MIAAACALLVTLLPQPQGAVYTGKLADQPTTDGRMVGMELKPSARPDVPGWKTGDKVLTVRMPQFKSPGAPAGFEIVLLETAETTYLFADRDLDGRMTESDRVAELRDTRGVTSWDYEWQLRAGGPDGPVLPVKARLTVNRAGDALRWMFLFTPTFRVEGHVEIGGRRTLVSLPFKTADATVDVMNGYIGIDSDGDGKIASGSLSPEYVAAEGQPVVLRMGDRYVAIESADYAARSFVVKQRPASDYTLIEVKQGEPLDDFGFKDFEGRSRKLSDFRGKHVLIDFWGSWCKPCVEDVPMMQQAYDRFRERGFEILGIDFEMGNTAEKVRPFLKEKGVEWPNGTPESVRDLVENRFRIASFPTLILLDPKGVVIETRSPQLRGKNLIATLERIFEAK